MKCRRRERCEKRGAAADMGMQLRVKMCDNCTHSAVLINAIAGGR